MARTKNSNGNTNGKQDMDVTLAGKRGPTQGEGGAPLKTVNWDQFDTLCKMHCTREEIAFFFNMSDPTIEAIVQREKNQTFLEYFEEKKYHGKISLRRRQYRKAMNGSTAMLIWLGKQWLGQTDKSQIEQNVTGEISHDHDVRHKIDFNKLGIKELKALVQLTQKPDLIIDNETGQVSEE